MAEEAQGLCPLHHHHRGDHGSVPPQVLKAETKTHEVLRPAVGRFSVQHLDYWRMSLSNPWVLATVSRGYTLQFRHRPVYRNPSDSCQGSDQFNGPVTKNLFTVAGRSQRKSFRSPKMDRGFWPVLDLCRLNVFLKSLPLRMLRKQSTFFGL